MEKGKKWGLIAAIFLFGGMGAFYSCVFLENKKTEALEFRISESEEDLIEVAQDNPKEEIVESIKENKEGIFVHVCGQVKKPGIYELLPDSRVADGIEAAGGFTSNAQKTSVNLARRLQDGEQLYVLSIEESKQASVEDRSGSSDKININTAGKEILMQLPGIGEAKAEAILTYRSKHGDFLTVEDLKKIEGIKDGVFEKIKDRITV